MGVVVGAAIVVIVVSIDIFVIAMAFGWIDDVEGLGLDDGVFDGGKDATFDGSRRRHGGSGTGTYTGLVVARDGIASYSTSS